MTVSQGLPVRLNCTVEGLDSPDIHWMKDGAVIETLDEVFIQLDDRHWVSFLRCRTRGHGAGAGRGQAVPRAGALQGFCVGQPVEPF